MRVPEKMGLPGKKESIDPYIKNPYHNKELLTFKEALDTIGLLATMLSMDIRIKENG